MKDKKNIILLAFAVAFFILALCFYMYMTLNTTEEVEIVQNYTIDPNEESHTEDIKVEKFVDASIYKKDNTEVKMSSFNDKPTMILFLDGKEDSNKVLDKVESMYSKYKQMINFVVIDNEENVNKKYSNDYSMEVYYDFYREVVRKYDISSYPSMIFLTKNQEVMNAKTGVISSDALEANLDIISENF